MAQIVFNIETEKLNRIKTALKGLNPIPKKADGTPQYTENVWAKECIRRWIIKQVARYEQKTARDAIKYNEENDLLT